MTANVRFVPDNAADRATITASSTAGALVAANLQLDSKADVWRSTANTAQTLLLAWPAGEIVDSVCLAWTNLTGLATVRLRGFAEVNDYVGSPQIVAFDETFAPDDALRLGEFVFGVDPLAASGAARARVASQVQCWLAAVYALRKLEITITDTTNGLAYIEASRLCVGLRISPLEDADRQGYSIGWVERSKPERAESGDLRVEPLGRYRRLALNLNALEPASRNAMLGMVANGLGDGVWVSVMSEDADTSNQQLHAFWGALVQDAQFSLPEYNAWATTLVFEEMA